MRKVIESTLVALDGVIEDPAKWAGDYLDADFQQGALERLLDTGAMLMGRLFREGERALLGLIDATSLPTGIVVMRYKPAA